MSLRDAVMRGRAAQTAAFEEQIGLGAAAFESNLLTLEDYASGHTLSLQHTPTGQWVVSIDGDQLAEAQERNVAVLAAVRAVEARSW